MFFDQAPAGRRPGSWAAYDARFSGVSYTPGESTGDGFYDPERRGRGAAVFNAAFNDYVRRELKFESDIPYEALIRCVAVELRRRGRRLPQHGRGPAGGR
jgi:hypothetical protein